MKRYSDKSRKGIIVFFIALMTMGIISPKIIYANEETEPRIEQSVGNDELENVDNSFNQENNSSVDLDIEKDTEDIVQIHKHLNEMVNSDELEIMDDEILEEASIIGATSEHEENAEKPAEKENDTLDGWVEENNNSSYYEEGELVTGWKEIEGEHYYFDQLGNVVKDTVIEIDNNIYRFDDSGALIVGWYENSSGFWYYYALDTGILSTGWQQINGKWYYLHADGAMATGWQYINNVWYYLNANGSLVTETSKITGKTHVFSSSGAWQGSWIQNRTGWWYNQANGSYPVDQWTIIDSEWYYFDSLGYMSTGWQELGGDWYYLKSNGIMSTGWQWVRGDWYYFESSGQMQTGWQEIDNNWYYLNASGRMITGWQKIANNWYYLSTSGEMTTGWRAISNNWYYFKDGGSMITGSLEIGEKVHAFSSSGAWQGSWIKNNVGWWFEDTDGSYPNEQWMKIMENWYYFNNYGYIKTGWEKIDNNWYYLKSDGSMATGWQYISNNWYYLDSNGAMATGWKKIGNNWYYLYTNGSMAFNTFIGKYKLGADGAWINYVIYLDPGHGGIPRLGGNPGAVYNGVKEQDLNLIISLKVRDKLEKLGYTVVMARENDNNSYHNHWRDDLYARPAHANEIGADILVSVHHNASGTWDSSMNGIETYIYGVNSLHPPLPENMSSHIDPVRLSESRKLANLIHKDLIANTNAYDRGVKTGAFIAVREAKMPAVLLELGFMSNRNELNNLTNSNYQQKLIDGIVTGIHNYFTN